MKPKEQAGRSGLVSLRVLLAGAICLSIPLLLLGATGPSWWYNPVFTTSGSAPVISGTANDYAAVNQGQVKNIAVTAINELNAGLFGIGGAGATLNSLAASLSATSGSTNDFAVVNLGQLKTLAKPFYDRLLSIDYSGPPLTSSTYPWISSGLTPNDYAVANIGQVKNLFSFDLTYSSDGNPLPNWWRTYYYDSLNVNPYGSVLPSNGAINNIDAWHQQIDPLPSPVFVPATTVVSARFDVTISATGAAAIYYTTDGSNPTSASNLYSAPIPISKSEMLQAVAYYGNAASAVSTIGYSVINGMTQLASGCSVGYSEDFNFTIALKSDGTVWAWGDNSAGELGSGTGSTFSPYPVQIPGLTNVVAVAAADNPVYNGYAAALKSDGTVWIWGEPPFNVTSGSGGILYTPTEIPSIPGMTAIAAGQSHMLATATNGVVWSWGSNAEGQLGRSGTSGIPASVTLSGTIISVAAGDAHSLALANNGTVWSWGENNVGQLGNGNPTGTGTAYWTPALVQTSGSTTLTAVTSVAASYEISFAITGTNGGLDVWGYNSNYRLGLGSSYGSVAAHAVPITGLTGVTAVAPSYDHVIATTATGSAFAWGYGYFGQLGLSGTPYQVSTPENVPGLNGCIGAATALYYSVVSESNGSLWVFGRAYDGGLGLGTYPGAGNYQSLYSATGPLQGLNLLGNAPVTAKLPGGTIIPSSNGDLVINPEISANAGQVVEVNFYVGATLIGQATSPPFSFTWKNAQPGVYNVTVETVTSTGLTSTSPPVQVKIMRSGYDSVAAGNAFNTILRSDGSVWSVGSNALRQLGDGTAQERLSPVYVHGLNQVIAIANGYNHGLALRSDGTVWSWGNTGLGTNAQPLEEVPSLGGIISIAGGNAFSLALDSNGNVWASGTNSNGQLGLNPSSVSSTSSVIVQGLPKVVAIAAGNNSAYALDSIGNIWAWGGNGSGQLGNNSTTDAYTPVKTLSGMASLAAGKGFALAVDLGGAVWSWGSNSNGQLGYSGTTGLTAAKISGLSGIGTVSAGVNFSLALDGSGNVWAWGANSAGQLGNTGYPSGSNTPVPVSNISQVVDIAASGSDAIAVDANGVVWGWGLNANGQLGMGDLTSGSIPIQMGGLQGTVATAEGATHTVALHGDGTVWAWGSNSSGQLGNSSTSNSVIPVQVTGVMDAVAVASGSNFSLALESDGSVWAWGENPMGQLGDGTTISKSIPLKIPSLRGAVAISAGMDFALALTESGSVEAWGDGTLGQMGNPTVTGCSTAPVPVSNLAGIAEIAAGGYHGLALDGTGGVWSWGRSDYGQLGRSGSNTIPGHVSGLSGTTIGIAAGDLHSLALSSTGAVMAWGDGANGQLGNTPTVSSTTPLTVSGLPSVVSIAAGQYDSIAMGYDGSIWIWGDNSVGELGNNSTTNSSTPIELTGYGGGAISVSSGNQASFIELLQYNGAGWAWGLNSNGQLGDGTTSTQLTPVASSDAGSGPPTGAPSFTLVQPAGAVLIY